MFVVVVQKDKLAYIRSHLRILIDGVLLELF